MQTGEKALGVAVLNQSLVDFIDGCEMFSIARKSMEEKGVLPSTYSVTIQNFNDSVSLFVPVTSGQKMDLNIWAAIADTEPEVLTQKFKAILSGEGKLEGKSYYPYMRDRWICDAYLHNYGRHLEVVKIEKLKVELKKLEKMLDNFESSLTDEQKYFLNSVEKKSDDEKKKNQVIKSKLKKMKDDIEDTKDSITSLEKKISFQDCIADRKINKNNEKIQKLKDSLLLQGAVDKSLICEKIKDLQYINKIYENKSFGNKKAHYVYEGEQLAC